MLQPKYKRNLSIIAKKIKLLFSLPSIRVSIVILILAIVSIIISKGLHEQDKSFESSLFSNIFAGLITGFVLSLFSSIKTVYISNLQAKVSWLEETRKMITKHLEKEKELWNSVKKSDEDFFDVAYETGAFSNHVNQRLIQSQFDKVKWFEPASYFLKNYNYDCMEMADILSNLREYIYLNGGKVEMRKDIINEIKKVTTIMSSLNHDVFDDIESIKIKIASSKKSII